ncbi:hypothetical protein KY308_00200, partial [Candidatus Woesearchaeota archaeon]|nr:hypothetical protein [Candidatus Woesearchaeota archaeon]
MEDERSEEEKGKMTETAEEFIERSYKNRKGKHFQTKDISRKGVHNWQIEEMTFLTQSNAPNKVYVIERISYKGAEGVAQIHKNDYKEYRMAYWIVGATGNKKGKWTYGQYTPHINAKDFWELIGKAVEEGTILKPP